MIGIVLVLAACSSAAKSEREPTVEAAHETVKNPNPVRTIVDTRSGTKVATLPLPTDWTLESGDGPYSWQITGPHDLRVFSRGSIETFPRGMGHDGSSPPGPGPSDDPGRLAELLKDFIMPRYQGQAWTFESSAMLPEVAAANHRFHKQLVPNAPFAMSHYALETRWADKEGRAHLVIVHVQVDPLVMMWACTFTHMFSDPEVFEASRTVLLDGLKAFEMPPR